VRNKTRSKDKQPVANDALDFRNLVGYEGALKKLASLHVASRLPAALLIEGRKGIGKRLFAAAVSSLAFCRYGVACGQCDACQSVIYGFNEDILWLETDEPSIKIDDIKKLQEHLSIRSQSFSTGSSHDRVIESGMRIAVIIDADKMTDQAANRLLKTLEEPASRVMIILTSSRAKNILPTILSRVIKWRVMPPDLSSGTLLLQQLLAEAGHLVPDARKIGDVLLQSGGSPGLALQKLLAWDDEKEALIDAGLAKILSGNSARDVLEIAEKLGKDSKVSIADIVEKLELMLNGNYKKFLAAAGERTVNTRRIAERRRILNDVRRYAVRGKIVLNNQMILENLGLNPNS
jgi:DNA polymerase III delta prime subunit